MQETSENHIESKQPNESVSHQGRRGGNDTKYDRKPNHEFKASLSADGKHWILRSIETWIIPVNYLAAIERNHPTRYTQTSAPPVVEKPELSHGTGSVPVGAAEASSGNAVAKPQGCGKKKRK